jgi:hypothetical protein
MNYKNFLALPEATQAALLAGYDLPELEFREKHSLFMNNNYKLDVVESIFGPLVAQDIDALVHGFELRAQMNFVFSADHMSELKKDIESYNLVSTYLNKQYGDIVVPDGGEKAIGIVGHRKIPFAIMTSTTYNKVTGEHEVAMRNLKEELEQEDAAIRAAGLL